MASVVEILIRSRDQFSAQFKKADDGMKQLIASGAALTGIGTAVGGAMVLMAQKTAEAGDEFQKTAIRTGLTTEQLSGLKFAAEQSGSSFETLANGLRIMARNANEAAQGTATQKDAFDALGLSATNADGSLRPMNDLLLDAADRFSQMTNDTEAAALAQDVFGRSGTELLPFLTQGRDGIKGLTDQAAALGVVYSQDLADASAEYLDTQNELSTAFDGLSKAVSEAIIPALTAMIDKITPLVTKLSEWVSAHPGLVQAIGGVAAGLVGAGGLLLAIGGITTAIPLLTTALAAIGGPITLLIGGIVALAANLYTMRAELGAVVLFVYSQFLGALSSIVSTLNLIPSAINPFSNALTNLEDKLDTMSAEADDASNAMLELDAQQRANAEAARAFQDPVVDLTFDLEDLTTAVDDGKESLFNMEQALFDIDQALRDDFEQRLVDTRAAMQLTDEKIISVVETLETFKAAASTMPVPPKPFDVAWKDAQVASIGGVLTEYEDLVGQFDTLQSEKKAAAASKLQDDFNETFNGLKSSFGSVFEAMIAGDQNPLANVASYFKNLFSKVFFEDILGSWISGFITPFVQKFKDLLGGAIANLGFGAISGAGSSAAGSVAGSAGSGGLGIPIGGGFDPISASLNAVSTLVSAFAGRGRAQRTEENTRETRDWLELQTTAWTPQIDSIQWYVANQIAPSLVGGKEDQARYLTQVITSIEDLKTITDGMDSNTNSGLRAIAGMASDIHGVLSYIAGKVAGLDGENAARTIAPHLDRLVTTEGVELTATRTLGDI